MSVCLFVSGITVDWAYSALMLIGPTNGKSQLTFGRDPISDTDSMSFFPFPQHYMMGILGDLLAFLIH